MWWRRTVEAVIHGADVGDDSVKPCKQRCGVLLNLPFDIGNRVIRILTQAPKKG